MDPSDNYKEKDYYQLRLRIQKILVTKAPKNSYKVGT